MFSPIHLYNSIIYYHLKLKIMILITLYANRFLRLLQKTLSADRDKCTGCEGLLANRFFGNFSNVFSSCVKSGLFPQ